MTGDFLVAKSASCFTLDRMTWKAKLGSQIPAELGKEIDVFETQMELRKLGKIDEKLG